MTADQIVGRYRMEAKVDGRDLEIPCDRFYHKLLFMSDGPEDVEPGGWREEWNNGYRAVWINEEERAILTYCEGDLTLTIDAAAETFARRLESATAFYERAA